MTTAKPKYARRKSHPRLSYDQLMANATALVPVLEKRAQAAEDARQLPRETMEDLYDAGLLRVLTPAAYGGLELDWPALPDAARVIARACPSTAWIIAVVGGHSGICARFSKEIQDEVFADGPDQLYVTASAQTTGTIVKVKDGARLNGVWRFGSGSDHADWMMVTGEVMDEAGKKTGLHARALCRADQVEVVDTWHVAGMKGTGSKDLNFKDVFVPDRHLIDQPENFGASPPGASLHPDCYLYDVPFVAYFSSWLLGPVLGSAEGAYDAYLSTTRGRVGAMSTQTVAQIHTVQERLAESFCELDAARALYDKHNRYLHMKGAARENIRPDEFVESGRERTYIGRLCFNAAHRLVRQMGAVGIFDTNPVQRHYRDLNVMQNQLALNWDVHMLNFGRRQLGLPTGMERIDNPPPAKPAWGLLNGKARKV